VLSRLEGHLLDPAGREREPERLALSEPGQSLIRTRLGRIDAMGALHDGRGYQELAVTAETINFDGRPLRVIDLETLIEIKSGTGGAKDRLVIPILLALARERAGERNE
jgi:hypothetical protein